jgi:hypothetical protein
MSTSTNDGSNQLARDSKLGNLANSAGAALIGAAVTWLSDLDWSGWPAWVVTLGGPAVGLAAGWLTSFKAKRFPGR